MWEKLKDYPQLQWILQLLLNWLIVEIIGGLIVGSLFIKSRLEKRRVERELNKYKNPILYAAFKLHKRLDTVFDRLMAHEEFKYWLCEKIPDEAAKLPHEQRKRLEKHFKKPFDRHYFVIATIYSIAELIAWIQIFHKAALRFEFIGSKAIKKFMKYLDLIRIAFCERKLLEGLYYKEERQWERVFEYFFESTGETLITRELDGSFNVMPFLKFLSKYKQPLKKFYPYEPNNFRKQCQSIRNLLVNLQYGNKNDLRWDRLVAIYYFVKLFLDKNTPKETFLEWYWFIPLPKRRGLFRQIRNRRKTSKSTPSTPITDLFYPEHKEQMFKNIKKFKKEALFK